MAVGRRGVRCRHGGQYAYPFANRSLQRRTEAYRDYVVRALRPESLGWSTADPVYAAAVKARDAIEAFASALRDAEVRATAFLRHYGPGLK